MDRRPLAALAVFAAAYLYWSWGGNETLAESSIRDHPIARAAYLGDVDQLRAELARPGADANKPDLQGWTPLQHAVSLEAHNHNPQGNHLAAAQILLKAGAKPDMADHPQNRPLQRAVWNPDMVELLLEAGASVNDAPLAAAAYLGDPMCQAGIESTRRLLKAGAPVDGMDGSQLTPLAIAAVYGCPGLVSTLLDAGANPRATVGANRPLLEWVKFAQGLHQKGIFGQAWKQVHEDNLKVLNTSLKR